MSDYVNGDYVDRSPLPYRQDQKAMRILFTSWIDDPDNDDMMLEIEHSLPARFAVCQNCEGRGLHSKQIGVITSFDDWDSDEVESYFRGDYDMICEECNGLRVVLEPEERKCTAEQLVAFEKLIREEWNARQEQLAEMRMGA